MFIEIIYGLYFKFFLIFYGNMYINNRSGYRFFKNGLLYVIFEYFEICIIDGCKNVILEVV